MIIAVLICKDCGFHAGIIPGTMQEIIILGIFVNTEQQIRFFKTPSERIDIL